MADSTPSTQRQLPSNWVPILEAPSFRPRKLRVVCVGAGFSGLMLAYQHKFGEPPMDQFMDLQIYDKNSDVGGTWLENRYPGVGCDVPAHIYTFPFEPNPSWSTFYASGPEIWQYIKNTTNKYGLDENISFNSKMISSTWDDKTGKWRLMIQQGDSETYLTDEADILINGTGFLNRWRWPTIDGLHSFHGKLLHTADWDPNLDWAGKKIAIIGNGSSAIQLLPKMQPTAARIVNYVRGPLWISSAFASEFTPEGKDFTYTEEQKQSFRDDPEKLYKLRHDIEHAFNKLFYVSLKDTPEQAAAFATFKKRMEEMLNHDPFLCAKLIPTFEVGCRRLSPGDSYLEALQKDNVSLQFTHIKQIFEKGIETQDQVREDFDIIVCATGFDVGFHPPWDIKGKDGISLAEQWGDTPQAYFGACANNMPNFFIVNGPNSPLAHGSLLSVMYWTVEYILRWCRKISTQNIKSALVKPAALDDYNVYTEELLKRTVWAGNCRSWFKNGKVDGRVNAMYGGSVIHFKEILKEFRTEDFDFTYTSKNRFQFMGNGTTMREARGEDLAYYVTK